MKASKLLLTCIVLLCVQIHSVVARKLEPISVQDVENWCKRVSQGTVDLQFEVNAFPGKDERIKKGQKVLGRTTEIYSVISQSVLANVTKAWCDSQAVGYYQLMAKFGNQVWTLYGKPPDGRGKQTKLSKYYIDRPKTWTMTHAWRSFVWLGGNTILGPLGADREKYWPMPLGKKYPNIDVTVVNHMLEPGSLAPFAKELKVVIQALYKKSSWDSPKFRTTPLRSYSTIARDGDFLEAFFKYWSDPKHLRMLEDLVDERGLWDFWQCQFFPKKPKAWPPPKPRKCSPPPPDNDPDLCQVGPWSEWSTECSRVEAGYYAYIRTREIIQAGKLCPELIETRGCDPPQPLPPPELQNPEAKLEAGTQTLLAAAPLSLFLALTREPDDPTKQVEWTPEAVNNVLAMENPDTSWCDVGGYYSGWCMPFNGPSEVFDVAKSKSGTGSRRLLQGMNMTRDMQVAVDGYLLANGKSLRRRLAGTVITGRLLFDGASFNIEFGAFGSAEEQEDANAVFVDTTLVLQPWLQSNDGLTPGSSGLLLDMLFEYDVDSGLMTFRAQAGNYAFLINSFGHLMEKTFGVRPPAVDPSTDVPTIDAELVISKTDGLQSLEVGLGGSLSLRKLAGRIGFDWNLEDEMLTISNPRVRYSTNPSTLAISLTADVPILHISATTATLEVSPGPRVVIEVTGEFTPFDKMSITNVRFEATQGDLLGEASGTYLGLDFDFSISYPNKSTDQPMRMTLTASDVEIGDVVNEALSVVGLSLPDFLTEICNAVPFKTVTVGITSATSGNSKQGFSIKAIPDIEQVPYFSQLLEMLDLRPEDLSLSLGPDGIEFGVQKAFALNLKPESVFTAPASLTLKAGVGIGFSGSSFQSERAPALGNDGPGRRLQEHASVIQERYVAVRDRLQGLDARLEAAARKALKDFAATSPGSALHLAPHHRTLKGVSLGALFMEGNFTATMDLPGVKDPVTFSISLGIGFKATELGPSITMKGGTLSPIAFENFDFIRLDSVFLGVTLVPSKAELAITYLEVSGDATICGQRATGAFFMDQGSGALGFKTANLSNFDLQFALKVIFGVELGSLNPFGIYLRDVEQTFADMAIPSLGIDGPGMKYKAKMTFLMSLTADVSFTLDTTGTEFNATVYPNIFGELLTKEVIEKLKEGIRNAKTTVSAGADAANAGLTEAQAEVNEARAALEQAKATYDALVADANEDIESARTQLAVAEAAFDRAKADAKRAFDAAQKLLKDAKAAFDVLQQQAWDGLTKANQAIQTAQDEWNKVVPPAKQKVDEALAEVQSLWAQYAVQNSECDAWPHHWDHCIAAGGLWIGAKIAEGTLKGAQKLLDEASGLVNKALDEAQKGVADAQKRVDAVWESVEYRAIESAQKALEAAEKASNDVLEGTQWAAVQAANGVLDTARKVLTGTQVVNAAVTIKLANATLDLAIEGLRMAQTAVALADATTQEVLSGLDSALGFIAQLNTGNNLKFQFRLKKDEIRVYASFQVNIADVQASGQVEVTVEDPLKLLIETIKKAILGQAINTKDSVQYAVGYLSNQVCPTGTYLEGQDCKACPNTCTVCNGPKQCTACVAGLELQQVGQDTTCGCGAATYESGSECKPCPTGCVSCHLGAQCVGCPPPAPVCSTCRPGFTLTNGRCECAAGKYVSGQQCVPCSAGCSSCNSGTACTACKTNYLLQAGQCECGDGFYILDGSDTCEACPRGCQACSGPVGQQNCTSCFERFTLATRGSRVLCDTDRCQTSSGEGGNVTPWNGVTFSTNMDTKSYYGIYINPSKPGFATVFYHTEFVMRYSGNNRACFSDCNGAPRPRNGTTADAQWDATPDVPGWKCTPRSTNLPNYWIVPPDSTCSRGGFFLGNTPPGTAPQLWLHTGESCDFGTD